MTKNKTLIRFNFSTIFLVFLILKLTNVINWSWWWITSPIWIVPLFLILYSFSILFLAFVIVLFTNNK